VLGAESLRRRLGQRWALALAPDLCTSNGRPTLTYENKYGFLPVLLMATKIAKVSKLWQAPETVPVRADRSLPALLSPAAARAAVLRRSRCRRSSRAAGDALPVPSEFPAARVVAYFV